MRSRPPSSLAEAAQHGRQAAVPTPRLAARRKIGERIFDERLSVYSDPWHPDLPGDGLSRGWPSGPQGFILVRNGVFGKPSVLAVLAREKGKEPTPGPGKHIVESAAPAASVEEMIKATDRGLLVSRFWYIRGVDPRTALFTGLTRDGVWLVGRERFSTRFAIFASIKSIPGTARPRKRPK